MVFGAENLVDKGKLYRSWSLQMMIAAGLSLPAAAMGMPGIFVFEAVSRPQKLITSRQLELTLSRRHWKKEGHHIKWSDGPNRLPPQPVGTCLRNGQTHAEHGDPDAEALLSCWIAAMPAASKAGSARQAIPGETSSSADSSQARQSLPADLANGQTSMQSCSATGSGVCKLVKAPAAEHPD